MNLQPFESIDKLLQVEVRESNSLSGTIPKLYELVRNEQPLSYLTAKAFYHHPGSIIGIISGNESFPFLPHGEIDGLCGSAFLARALGILGYEVKIFTEDGCKSVIDALLYEFNIQNTECISVSSMKSEEILEFAAEIDIGVAVEKLGINRKGIVHTIEGKNFTDKVGPFYGDIFINRLNDYDKVTIGYGDGGNEIGFGKIFHQVRKIVPKGSKCACPCGDGLATITSTSILWPVNVSNFGAYGTVAGLAIFSGRKDLSVKADEQIKALSTAVAHGAIDGWTGKPTPSENGIPAEIAAGFVRIMQGIVDKSFEKQDRLH